MRGVPIKRRSFLGAAGAMLGAAPLAQPAIAQPTRVLKMVPHANLTSIDPIWTTANITRNHGHMVYDTLYGIDASLAPQPQMAAGHVVEDGGLRVTITLRPGLRFHDNEKVRAADAVASIRRWMKRTPYGQKLETVLDDLSAVDDTRLVVRLRKPFPLLFAGLGQVSSACFIMPERIAVTDPFKQIAEATGSGPFRFKKDEYNSGSLVVYERNPGYVPREGGAPSLIAGPKQVFITDAATAAAALQRGEIDWFEQPPPELQLLLARNRNLAVEVIDERPLPGILRLNCLQPPFDNKKLRQALLPAIVQADFMSAVVGPDPAGFRADLGAFTPGTPLANSAGLEAITGPRSVERARAMMREAGYSNQPMRLIGPTDILAPAAMTQMAADTFRRLGFNMDFVLTDWGTVIQRRGSREPLEKGGWSALCTAFSSFDQVDPAGHVLLRGNGAAGWPGWPSIPRLEELRDAWFDAPDLPAQQAIAQDIQRVVFDEVPYVPLGAYYSRTALARNLSGRVSGLALFWNLRRT
jgi:peptide/nickel transport system substrate-binding protein